MKRTCGILLHLTSLGGNDIWQKARAFADKLAFSGQSWWQLLPLSPACEGGSPYFSSSVFALGPQFSGGISRERGAGFADFCEEQGCWLNDYALFTALSEKDARPFWQWDEEFAKGSAAALLRFSLAEKERIKEIKAEQYGIFREWLSLRKYACSLGIRIMGDLPFYPAPNSADRWAHPELFEKGRVAGCPPDGFSDTGQLWGNPTYDFAGRPDECREWWLQRLRLSESLFDAVRIDHFRGLCGYYSIPEGGSIADGEWRRGPGEGLLAFVKQSLPGLELIAEDLGYLTPEVAALRKSQGIFGMSVLQFAFSPRMDSLYLPHNIEKDSVVYTGTHDNDTSNGWFASSDEDTRRLFMEYSGMSGGESAARAMARLAYSSAAELAILPMQDVLELPSSARMNTPATVGGSNWRWRMEEAAFGDKQAEWLAECAHIYGRAR